MEVFKGLDVTWDNADARRIKIVFYGKHSTEMVEIKMPNRSKTRKNQPISCLESFLTETQGDLIISGFQKVAFVEGSSFLFILWMGEFLKPHTQTQNTQSAKQGSENIISYFLLFGTDLVGDSESLLSCDTTSSKHSKFLREWTPSVAAW